MQPKDLRKQVLHMIDSYVGYPNFKNSASTHGRKSVPSLCGINRIFTFLVRFGFKFGFAARDAPCDATNMRAVLN